jgi:hypothetical protein
VIEREKGERGELNGEREWGWDQMWRNSMSFGVVG